MKLIIGTFIAAALWAQEGRTGPPVAPVIDKPYAQLSGDQMARISGVRRIAALEQKIASLTQEIADLAQELVLIQACNQAGLLWSECDPKPDGMILRKQSKRVDPSVKK